jgi:glycerol-1-phosphate dehydrogenase [NAD(P)+]
VASDTEFPLTVEAGAATARLNGLSDHVVCTTPQPWALVSAAVPAPLAVVQSRSTATDALERAAASVPATAEVVVGLGGGSSLDTAKYVAHSCGLELISIPSILSADAAFTPLFGYREGGRVRYAGGVRPREVIVDPELLRRAPIELGRAGVGDLLACHTALYDWRLASSAGRGEAWQPQAAEVGMRVLDDLEALLPELVDMTDEAVAGLAEGLRTLGAARTASGRRLAQGSEHALAAVLEWLSGRSFVHGRLIAFCVLVMSQVQGNDPGRPERILRGGAVGVAPDALGVDSRLLERAFEVLPAYAQSEQLAPSVIDVVELSPELAAEVFAATVAATS